MRCVWCARLAAVPTPPARRRTIRRGGSWFGIAVLLVLVAGGWWGSVSESNRERNGARAQNFLGPVALLIAAGLCAAVGLWRLLRDRQR